MADTSIALRHILNSDASAKLFVDTIKELPDEIFAISSNPSFLDSVQKSITESSDSKYLKFSNLSGKFPFSPNTSLDALGSILASSAPNFASISKKVIPAVYGFISCADSSSSTADLQLCLKLLIFLRQFGLSNQLDSLFLTIVEKEYALSSDFITPDNLIIVGSYISSNLPIDPEAFSFILLCTSQIGNNATTLQLIFNIISQMIYQYKQRKISFDPTKVIEVTLKNLPSFSPQVLSLLSLLCNKVPGADLTECIRLLASLIYQRYVTEYNLNFINNGALPEFEKQKGIELSLYFEPILTELSEMAQIDHQSLSTLIPASLYATLTNFLKDFSVADPIYIKTLSYCIKEKCTRMDDLSLLLFITSSFSQSYDFLSDLLNIQVFSDSFSAISLKGRINYVSRLRMNAYQSILSSSFKVLPLFEDKPCALLELLIASLYYEKFGIAAEFFTEFSIQKVAQIEASLRCNTPSNCLLREGLFEFLSKCLSLSLIPSSLVPFRPFVCLVINSSLFTDSFTDLRRLLISSNYRSFFYEALGFRFHLVQQFYLLFELFIEVYAYQGKQPDDELTSLMCANVASFSPQLYPIFCTFISQHFDIAGYPAVVSTLISYHQSSINFLFKILAENWTPSCKILITDQSILPIIISYASQSGSLAKVLDYLLRISQFSAQNSIKMIDSKLSIILIDFCFFFPESFKFGGLHMKQIESDEIFTKLIPLLGNLLRFDSSAPTFGRLCHLFSKSQSRTEIDLSSAVLNTILTPQSPKKTNLLKGVFSLKSSPISHHSFIGGSTLSFWICIDSPYISQISGKITIIQAFLNSQSFLRIFIENSQLYCEITQTTKLSTCLLVESFQSCSWSLVSLILSSPSPTILKAESMINESEMSFSDLPLQEMVDGPLSFIIGYKADVPTDVSNYAISISNVAIFGAAKIREDLLNVYDLGPEGLADCSPIFCFPGIQSDNENSNEVVTNSNSQNFLQEYSEISSSNNLSIDISDLRKQNENNAVAFIASSIKDFGSPSAFLNLSSFLYEKIAPKSILPWLLESMALLPVSYFSYRFYLHFYNASIPDLLFCPQIWIKSTELAKIASHWSSTVLPTFPELFSSPRQLISTIRIFFYFEPIELGIFAYDRPSCLDSVRDNLDRILIFSILSSYEDGFVALLEAISSCADWRQVGRFLAIVPKVCKDSKPKYAKYLNFVQFSEHKQLFSDSPFSDGILRSKFSPIRGYADLRNCKVDRSKVRLLFRLLNTKSQFENGLLGSIIALSKFIREDFPRLNLIISLCEYSKTTLNGKFELDKLILKIVADMTMEAKSIQSSSFESAWADMDRCVKSLYSQLKEFSKKFKPFEPLKFETPKTKRAFVFNPSWSKAFDANLQSRMNAGGLLPCLLYPKAESRKFSVADHQILFECKAQKITLHGIKPVTFQLTNTEVLVSNSAFLLSRVKYIFFRGDSAELYGIEFYIIGSKSYNLRFGEVSNAEIIRILGTLQMESLVYFQKSSGPRFSIECGAVNLMKERKISNLEFACIFSLSSNHSFNDFSHYPTLPWLFKGGPDCQMLSTFAENSEDQTKLQLGYSESSKNVFSQFLIENSNIEKVGDAAFDAYFRPEAFIWMNDAFDFVEKNRSAINSCLGRRYLIQWLKTRFKLPELAEFDSQVIEPSMEYIRTFGSPSAVLTNEKIEFFDPLIINVGKADDFLIFWSNGAKIAMKKDRKVNISRLEKDGVYETKELNTQNIKICSCEGGFLNLNTEGLFKYCGAENERIDINNVKMVFGGEGGFCTVLTDGTLHFNESQILSIYDGCICTLSFNVRMGLLAFCTIEGYIGFQRLGQRCIFGFRKLAKAAERIAITKNGYVLIVEERLIEVFSPNGTLIRSAEIQDRVKGIVGCEEDIVAICTFSDRLFLANAIYPQKARFIYQFDSPISSMVYSNELSSIFALSCDGRLHVFPISI